MSHRWGGSGFGEEAPRKRTGAQPACRARLATDRGWSSRCSAPPRRRDHQLAEIQENLKLIDHKIDFYRGRLAAGDADQL